MKNLFDLSSDSEQEQNGFNILDKLGGGTLVEKSDFTQKTRKRKKFIPNYDVEGVSKIIIQGETQTNIGIIVGEDVTIENPWKMIKKSLILENLESGGEASEFHPYRDKIIEYEDEEFLFGYIQDESRENDEFYFCWTRESVEHCWEQKEHFLRRQIKKLQKGMERKAKPWTSLGSEKEIDCLKPERSRALIEVEFNSRFPTALEPEYFSVKDVVGCVELRPYRAKYDNVTRRRVDLAVQAVQEQSCGYAQTILTYPKNMYTQTRSVAEVMREDNNDVCKESGTKTDEDEVIQKVIDRTSRTVEDFVREKLPALSECLKFNAAFDIYYDEYRHLSSTKRDEGVYSELNFEEYLVFTDIRTKGKYVSAAEWHPMWTGIIAIAYAETNANMMKKHISSKDQLKKAVFGINPVLIWSHIKSLQSSLYLNSPVEVRALSFCPWLENLLIGGCENGQVMIWDLKGKLKKVEQPEILPENRRRYRTMLNSRMGWVKNIHDPSIVEAAAMSSLATGHSASIQDIKWLSPNYSISKTGQLSELTENAKRSLIFMTCSEEGTILIWHLSAEILKLKEEKTTKKSKRIAERPEGLAAESSEYDIFNRVLQPIYKLNVALQGTVGSVPIISLGFNPPIIAYHPAVVKEKQNRKHYVPTIEIEEEGSVKTSAYIGTAFGELLKVGWEGRSFSTGEDINSESVEMKSRITIHDGSIASCAINPFMNDLIITVGGKVHALWCDSLPNEPLMWKRNRCNLAHVAWSSCKSGSFFITTSEGDIEIWDLLYASNVPVRIQNFSESTITGLYMHKLPMQKNIMAIADSHGYVSLYFLPKAFSTLNPESPDLETFISRQKNIKIFYATWLENWMSKNAAFVGKIRDKEVELEKAKANEIKKKQEEERKQREADEEAARIERARKIGPEERWNRLMVKFVEETVAAMKKLNKEELLRQEAPLRELEKHRSEKLAKQAEIIKNQKSIFEETVAILFPEAVVKAPERVASLGNEKRNALKRQYIEDYKTISETAKKNIEENPYSFIFDRSAVLDEGKDRRRALDKYTEFMDIHKERWNRDPVVRQQPVAEQPISTEITTNDFPHSPIEKLPDTPTNQ